MKNILLLNKRDVNTLLEDKETEIIDIIRETYLLHSKKKTVLPFSSFLRFNDNTKNRIIGLPAYLGGDNKIAGIKWISSFPQNIINGDERASAVTLLNDVSNGRVIGIIESSIISAKRTAASAALAAELLLEDKKINSVSLIGCGRINKEILHFLIFLFPTIKKVYLYDISEQQLLNFTNSAKKYDIELYSSKSIKEACEGSSLVSIATTASSPYINDISTFNRNKVILNISLRDISPNIIIYSNNIVDDVEHVCRENTSIALTEKEYATNSFINGTIADCINGSLIISNQHKPTIFSPFGLGILDLALCSFIFDLANKKHIGYLIKDFYDL